MPLFHLRLHHTTDLLGRRSLKNGSLYGYNIRDELISAEDTFHVHERKQDGGQHHRLIIRYLHSSQKVF